MNNTKQIAQQLLQIPIDVAYTQNFTNAQKVAGFILFSFFLFLGSAIFINGLEVDEYKIYYLLFGILLCSLPFILYFIVINSKNKSIILLDKEGVTLKNNKKLNWENLTGITYHTSLYAQNENEKYNYIEFKFTNGKAIVPYIADNFLHILYIAEKLPVNKKEYAVPTIK